MIRSVDAEGFAKYVFLVAWLVHDLPEETIKRSSLLFPRVFRTETEVFQPLLNTAVDVGIVYEKRHHKDADGSQDGGSHQMTSRYQSIPINTTMYSIHLFPPCSFAVAPDVR